MSVQIDNRRIEKLIVDAVSKGFGEKRIKDVLRERGKTIAARLSQRLISAFWEHPITRNLLGNPATNRPPVAHWPMIIKSRKGTHPYGNLVTFLGLTQGNLGESFEKIVSLFSTYRVEVHRSRGSIFTINIFQPQMAEFYQATPAPKSAYSGSWLQHLEKATLQNFSHYMHRARGFGFDSRSGFGAQVKYVLRKGAQTVPPIPYISNIFKTTLSRGNAAMTKNILGKSV